MCQETISVLIWPEADLNVLLTLYNIQAPFGKWPQVPIPSGKEELLSWKLSFWGSQRITPSWPESALNFSWFACLWRLPPAMLAKTNSLPAGPPLSISAHCLSLLSYLNCEYLGAETLFQYYGIQWSWSMARTLRFYWKKTTVKLKCFTTSFRNL